MAYGEHTIETLIMGMLVLVIGLALTPTVANSVAAATGGNVTGAAASVLPLVTLVWIIVVLVLGVGMIKVALSHK